MKKSLLFLFASLLISTLYLGCAKESGDYSYENPKETFDGSTYDYLKSKTGTFDSLLLVVDRLGLSDVLKNENVTIFAVTNQSFRLAIEKFNVARKATGGRLVNLSNYNQPFLDTLLCRYIFKGSLASSDFASTDGSLIRAYRGAYRMNAKTTYATSQGFNGGGATQITFSDTRYSTFTTTWLNTTANAVDIRTKNGIVHILESGHIFGFDNFTKERKPFKTEPFYFPTNINERKLLEAEDYDLGGEGVAFHFTGRRAGDSDKYRRDGFTLYSHSGAGTPVDLNYLFPTSLDIQGANSEDWVTWSIIVPEEGDYRIDARYRLDRNLPATTVRRYHIDFDLADSFGPVWIVGTDAYPAWSAKTSTYHLTAGPHVMRFYWEIAPILLDGFLITRVN